MGLLQPVGTTAGKKLGVDCIMFLSQVNIAKLTHIDCIEMTTLVFQRMIHVDYSALYTLYLQVQDIQEGVLHTDVWDSVWGV